MRRETRNAEGNNQVQVAGNTLNYMTLSASVKKAVTATPRCNSWADTMLTGKPDDVFQLLLHREDFDRFYVSEIHERLYGLLVGLVRGMAESQRHALAQNYHQPTFVLALKVLTVHQIANIFRDKRITDGLNHVRRNHHEVHRGVEADGMKSLIAIDSDWPCIWDIKFGGVCGTTNIQMMARHVCAGQIYTCTSVHTHRHG